MNLYIDTVANCFRMAGSTTLTQDVVTFTLGDNPLVTFNFLQAVPTGTVTCTLGAPQNAMVAPVVLTAVSQTVFTGTLDLTSSNLKSEVKVYMEIRCTNGSSITPILMAQVTTRLGVL